MLAMPILLAASSVLTLVTGQEPGTPLHLTAVVRDRGGQPIAGATVHVYQTDASGRYTPDKPMDERHARLSGTVTTDAEGRFEVHTICPGGYPQAVRIEGMDRHIPAHIHMDISAAGHALRRAQVVFADDPLLEDPYWRKWAASLNQPVAKIETRGQEHVAHIILTIE
ncbi:MAG: hypothetical protein ACREAA_01795 [Candidatus Polarisedimenticolia bacterium]